VSIDGAPVMGINTTPLTEARSVLPVLKDPAKILFQGGFAAVTPHASTTFNFADDDRAPLLFISGGSDHILPTVLQDHNYKKNAKHSTAIAAHKVFPGRDHYTCGEPGWEAVADFALDWALAPVAGELG
jgi:pimeloyl-ACP methyl ester carboxylesterase